MDLLSFFSLRSVILFASTAFSMMLVMLVLNIITVDDVIAILNLSPQGANALKLVISRIQEVTYNILGIISQLLNKLFSFAGINADLTKIKVDVNHNSSSVSEAVSSSSSAIDPAK